MGDVWRLDKPDCGVCQGHGFHANPLANRDGNWSCLRCDGASRHGLFVVQVVGRLNGSEVYDELSRQWAAFGPVSRFARGLAAVKDGSVMRVGPRHGRPQVIAVRVVYKTAGPDRELFRVPVAGVPYRPAAEAVAA